MTNHMTIGQIETKYPLTKKISELDCFKSPWMEKLLLEKDFKDLKIEDITINMIEVKKYITEKNISKLLDSITYEFYRMRVHKFPVCKTYFVRHKESTKILNAFLLVIKSCLENDKIIDGIKFSDHKFWKVLTQDNEEIKQREIINLFQNYLYLGIKLRTTLRMRYFHGSKKLKEADKEIMVSN